MRRLGTRLSERVPTFFLSTFVCQATPNRPLSARCSSRGFTWIPSSKRNEAKIKHKTHHMKSLAASGLARDTTNSSTLFEGLCTIAHHRCLQRLKLMGLEVRGVDRESRADPCTSLQLEGLGERKVHKNDRSKINNTSRSCPWSGGREARPKPQTTFPDARTS